MSRYERLQGALWHTRKENMKLVDAKISDNGNIKGFYRDMTSGKMFTHWMNNEEKREYNSHNSPNRGAKTEEEVER